MYHDILIVIETDKPNDDLLKFAADVADSYNAGLKIVLVGAPTSDQFAAIDFGMGGGSAAIASHMIRKNSKSKVSEFHAHMVTVLGDAAENATFIEIGGTPSEVDNKIINFMRTTDLYVCFNPLLEEANIFERAVFELALHHGTCGVYVSPRNLRPVGYARSIVVAWNLSREAARAVGHAMPILIRARSVSVLLVDPETRKVNDDWQPGKQMVDHLIRHDVRAKQANLTSTELSVSETIIAELDSTEARLVVMGGYGKNAIANWLLGSTAREILEKAQIPILMAT